MHYVTIDTFSGFLVATALTRKATKNVISFACVNFFMLGVPNQIKTDNGTGYYIQSSIWVVLWTIYCYPCYWDFLNNSQGQGIVEL